MSKKQARKSSKSKAAKRVIKVASFDVSKPILTAFRSETKKDGVSMCAAIRNVAKRFKKERRGVVEATLVKGARIDLGTARRQIQLGRA